MCFEHHQCARKPIAQVSLCSILRYSWLNLSWRVWHWCLLLIVAGFVVYGSKSGGVQDLGVLLTEGI